RAWSIAAALHQDAARTSAVHRVKIESILDLRSIRIAQFFVDRLLFRQRVLVGAPQRDVMHGTRTERPAAGRTIRLMQQRDRLVRAAGSRFDALIFPILARLA